MSTPSTPSAPLARLRDYVERSTHWREGGTDRHDALLALKELETQAGLCYFALESAGEFLKDVREIVADSLGKERPAR